MLSLKRNNKGNPLERVEFLCRGSSRGAHSEAAPVFAVFEGRAFPMPPVWAFEFHDYPAAGGLACPLPQRFQLRLPRSSRFSKAGPFQWRQYGRLNSTTTLPMNPLHATHPEPSCPRATPHLPGMGQLPAIRDTE